MNLWNLCKRAFIFLFGKGDFYNFIYRIYHNIKLEDYGEFVLVKQKGTADVLRLKNKNDYSLKLPLDFDFEVKPVRVAAVVHIFYIEMGEEIKNLLRNIPCVDVYISTNNAAKKFALEKIFSDFENGKVIVRVFENRGRDIAPAFVGFKDIYQNYNLCLHLHSKKSPHDSQLSDWGKYLYKTLLGNEKIVAGIFHIMERENIGVVFPQYFEPLRRGINFGKNYALAQNFLSKLKINLADKTLLEFPAGSMFWFKPAAVLPILESGLTFEDFPEENGQVDGTLAHAIERIFLYVAESRGFNYLKVTADEKSVDKTPVLFSRNEKDFAANIKKIYFLAYDRNFV